MTAGMGAVCTTLIAGVEAVRQGLAKPIGSTDADGHHPPGQAHGEQHAADQGLCAAGQLDDLVFTGWDIFGGNLYDAAKTAQVLDRDQLEQIRPFLRIDRADARGV